MISAVGRLVVYSATAGAALVLRREGPSAFSPPAWTHLATIAFCAWLFAYQTAVEALVVSAVIMGGTVLWFGYRAFAARGERRTRSGSAESERNVGGRGREA